jgi:hypothetical protein
MILPILNMLMIFRGYLSDVQSADDKNILSLLIDYYDKAFL